jgi:hypothetical protein
MGRSKVKVTVTVSGSGKINNTVNASHSDVDSFADTMFTYHKTGIFHDRPFFVGISQIRNIRQNCNRKIFVNSANTVTAKTDYQFGIFYR